MVPVHASTFEKPSIHLFTKQIAPLLCQELLTWSSSKLFFICALSTSFHQKHFVDILFFCIFIAYSTFSWACGSLREPQKFFFKLFLYIRLFVKYITQWISNLYQYFSHVCSSTSYAEEIIKNIFNSLNNIQ